MEKYQKPSLREEDARKILELMKQERGREALELGERFGLYTFGQLENAVIELLGETWKYHTLERDEAREIVNLIKIGKKERALELGKYFGIRTLDALIKACRNCGFSLKENIEDLKDK